LLGGTGEATAVDAYAPSAYAPSLSPAEWTAFTQRYLAPDGRIVDVENSRVTHSEGQGYGMLLAVEAGDREAFERIWRFTREHMQIRADKLIAWRWQPASVPHVADMNNASDGDILVAYALMVGGAAWNDVDLLIQGDRIVADIERKLVVEVGGLLVLKPGIVGFDEPHPVVNLSYYIYPAFRMFDAVRPGGPWRRLAADGERLTAAARFGRARLTPDWVAIDGGSLRLPNGFRKRSSYDAVRIPLYMMMDGGRPAPLEIFADAWGTGAPVDYDLASDRATAPMGDPGYRAIAGLVGCTVYGTPVSQRLSRFQPTTYFSSTLQLLTLSAMRRYHTECLGPEF
jgi:endoglucanase